MDKKIRIGISACLMGEKVRYDGGDKLDPFIIDTLGPSVEFVPVCPEAGMGLGVPREPMRLEGDPSSPRLVTINTRMDHTDDMLEWTRERLEKLAKEGLRGFILKARSPSCGMSVDVFADGEPSGESGIGIFARALMERFPMLPVIDEEKFRDTALREA